MGKMETGVQHAVKVEKKCFAPPLRIPVEVGQ
jgi:hypothetical protein